MAKTQIGIWCVGAWGGVSTTAAVGLAALQHGVAPAHGLVSGLPRFANLGLADWKQFIVGGHEIRQTSFSAEAQVLHEQSRVFDHAMLSAISGTLSEFDSNVRTGSLINVGKTIESLADGNAKKTRKESPAAAIERISADLMEFRENNSLDQVIVVNAASTEPPLENDASELDWSELSKRLKADSQSSIPASSIYAVAAMMSECSYVNFTPSIGSDLPALNELALQQGVLHVGRDGKTGETLLKSVLAPMFAARNLNVMSWVVWQKIL